MGVVKIWGIRIGALLWDENRSLSTFEFEPSFAEHGLNIAPVTMPLAQVQNGQTVYSFPSISKETYGGLSGLFSDSLPDRFGNALLDAWLVKQGRVQSSVNPIERLCYTSHRGMGALEYEPSMNPSGNNRSEIVEVDELVSLANDVLAERAGLEGALSSHSKEDLTSIIKVGTSAGGARAKAILAYNEKTGKVRSGQVKAPEGFTYWIMKFDGVTNKSLGDPQGYGRIEYAYYLMAKACGIEMNDCKLYTEGDRAHFMTKRFDRTNEFEKHHMQTLCGIAHFDYNLPGGYSYEQAFQIMRLLRLPFPQAEELFRRMIFNVVARNQDDHTKNISFLMNLAGSWKLSPAYDVTFAYDPNNKWMQSHQMTINGKRNSITRDDLKKIGAEMNIKKQKLFIEQVIDGVSRWQEFAKEAGVPKDQRDYIGNTHLLSV